MIHNASVPAIAQLRHARCSRRTRQWAQTHVTEPVKSVSLVPHSGPTVRQTSTTLAKTSQQTRHNSSFGEFPSIVLPSHFLLFALGSSTGPTSSLSSPLRYLLMKCSTKDASW